MSIGKSLINLEQNVKDDAMRPTICILTVVLVFSLVLLILAPDKFVRYVALVIACVTIAFVLYLNNYYAHNDTDRLHTERFLINKQIIESQMLENKNSTIVNDEPLKGNVQYLLEDEGDINE